MHPSLYTTAIKRVSGVLWFTMTMAWVTLKIIMKCIYTCRKTLMRSRNMDNRLMDKSTMMRRLRSTWRK